MIINIMVYGEAVPTKYNFDGSIDDIVPDVEIGDTVPFVKVLNISQGNKVTIPFEATLRIDYDYSDDISKYITNNGTLINNGTIRLGPSSKDELTVEEADAIYENVINVIKPTGTGIIEIGDYKYTNGGQYYYDDEVFNFTEEDIFMGTYPGFSVEGDATNGFTLTLDNLFLTGDVLLPSNVPVIIRTNFPSNIGGVAFPSDSNGPCDLTFEGPEELNILGDLTGNGTNGDTVNVQPDTHVLINGMLNIGASGGEGGILNVTGPGSVLEVQSESGSAVYGDEINVLNGGTLIATAPVGSSTSRGIHAGSRGVNVGPASTLSASGGYGVYIIGGTLRVQGTLATTSTVAPFCLVDPDDSELEDILTLPGLPDGTEIDSVRGNDELGYTYWSVVPTGGTLGVTDEYSEPVTLTGAGYGYLVFQAPSDDDEDTEDGSTEDSSTEDGSTEDSSTEDGSTEDGSTEGGSTANDADVTNPTENASTTATNANVQASAKTGDAFNLVFIVGLMSLMVTGGIVAIRKKRME